MERNVLSRNRVTGVAEIIHLQFIVTVSCAKHALDVPLDTKRRSK
jgi:hypothetical protein